MLFSSHLLAEVQQLCQRVVILHRGRLIREADLDELAGSDTLHLRASILLEEARLIPALKSLPCVRRVKTLPHAVEGASEVLLECTGIDAQTQLFHLLCALDAPIRLLQPRQDSLEDIFLRLTQDDGEVQA